MEVYCTMSTSGKTAAVQFDQPPGTLSRYDLLLLVLPLVLVTAALGGAVLPFAFEAAIAVGAAICAGLIVDAVFLHPPIPN